MADLLRVGGPTMDFAQAKMYVGDYTANTTRTWSYPAYDAYPGSPTETVELPDLLAVALLNAGQKPIVSYYALEALLPKINDRLMVDDTTGTLDEAGPATPKGDRRSVRRPGRCPRQARRDDEAG